MPEQARTLPLVSVIVPVFNASEFLRRCIDSVLAQTVQNFEIIAVNDGSTDNSLEILQEYQAAHNNILVVDQINAGQGTARNRALGLARGEFILFVDADDYIERVTLQVTTARAFEDESDLVHFDWKLYAPGEGRSGDMHYYNADPFWHKRILLEAECDELLRVQNFYSVTNLYRRTFLEMHNIRFEEGRIYEDNPFVLQAVNRAVIVSLVHSPLYTINPHPESTTRSNTDTDKHVRDHLYAVQRTFDLLDRRNPRSVAYLAAYHIKKIGPYYESRIPRRYRASYIRNFVEILHRANIEIPPGTSTNGPTRLAVRLGIFESSRARLFQAMIVGKNIIMPRYKRAKQTARTLKRRRTKTGAWSAAIETALTQPLLPKTVSFLGLDSRYTGNSRYLFEEMISDDRFADYDIRFVTADERVDVRYRLQPNNVETNIHLARTELLIAESWIPDFVRKHSDSTWVQLWHGTPLKRMLFDSHEPYITMKKSHHKLRKYADIQRWDYLLAESNVAADRFETAFLFPKKRMIQARYPRVEYLRQQLLSAAFREQARGEFGIRTESTVKVVLYAPTWRDLNYGRGSTKRDQSFLLDLEGLAESLGDEYLIGFHAHDYLRDKFAPNHKRCVDVSDIEIQDLILAADVVVTDYSSLAFDVAAIGRSLVFYTPDVEQFEEQRGLYREARQMLGFEGVESPLELTKKIQSINSQDTALVEGSELYSASLADSLAQLLLVDAREVGR